MISPSLRVQSPKKIDVQLRVIIDYLNLDELLAMHLKYKKPSGFLPEVAMCHFNVWLQCNQEGGDVQYGWILGQDKNAHFAEAIFHSVWKSPAGELMDVTPRSDQEKRVLFIPDQTRHIELSEHGGQPAIETFDNVRLQGLRFVTPLTPITAVMESEFIHQHHLWPW